MNLFELDKTNPMIPLADRMRPRNIDEIIGQDHLIGKNRLLRRAIDVGKVTSSIFYGPPGSGKTTLASLIAQKSDVDFIKMNAVTAGVNDVRAVLKTAKQQWLYDRKAPYLLLDECHRWSKAQSDSILPALEEGSIRFIGSTTENPMVSLTPALLSRVRVFEFKPIKIEGIISAILNALNDKERGYGEKHIEIEQKAIEHWAETANGDIRTALNALELAVLTTPVDEKNIQKITLEVAEESIQKPLLSISKDIYYDMLSAFCKSMRGSDSDAALAWFTRMLYAGVDPHLIVRRIIVHASEDVGLANPNAMLQASAAAIALNTVGMPEAKIPIAQSIIAVCESPKSNSVFSALANAEKDTKVNPNAKIPEHLKDSSYSLSFKDNKAQYLYPHSYPNHWVKQNYMPEGLENARYYFPTQQGDEKDIELKKNIKSSDKEEGRD